MIVPSIILISYANFLPKLVNCASLLEPEHLAIRTDR